MTKEELMKPRYKVIADYPGNRFKISTILVAFNNDSQWYEEGEFGKPNIPFLDRIQPYPHLFRKLEWWEERKPEDMPEYVSISGSVFKSKYYTLGEDGSVWFVSADCRLSVTIGNRFYLPFTPATESEYLSQQNTQQ